MRRLWRILRWVLIGIPIAILAAVIGVVVVARTRQAHELVRRKVVNLLTQTYRGQVAIGAIQGSLLGDLEIRDLVVSQNGEPVVTVPVTRIRYAVFPLVAGWVRLAEIELRQPRIKLARTSDGEWNVAAAFTARNPT